jgi:hypothetical protein
MRIAFLIMAHRDPEQIERLVNRLKHPDFDVYIHLDRKIDISPYLYLAQKDSVFFTKTRISVGWAAFTLTQAIYKSIEEILGCPGEYDFIDVHSGQDYPIRPADEIHAFFSARSGNNFFSFEKEGSEWWQDAYQRVTKYHLINYKFPGRYWIQYVLNALLPGRKFPLPYTLYGGPRACWYTINREAALYLVKFLSDNPKLRWFCKFTWGSDEFLAQTIIMNSEYAETVLNDVVNYMDWSAGGCNPKILTLEDYQVMLDSGRLFARKFEISTDARILDRLDADG